MKDKLEALKEIKTKADAEYQETKAELGAKLQAEMKRRQEYDIAHANQEKELEKGRVRGEEKYQQMMENMERGTATRS